MPAAPGAALPLGRRQVLLGLAATGGLVVTGCVGEGQTGIGLALVPEAQVRELGLETWQRIRAETRPSDNARYQRVLDEVGARLVQAAGGDPRQWEMVVFEGDEANAFALPGGKIGVYEGLFRYAETPAQLATVIGHEIAHNLEQHARERLSTQVATETGLRLLSAALQAGDIGYANEIAAVLGAGAQFGLLLPYSRNQELEADAIGLRLMARAGYDPRAAIAFWQNMARAGARPPVFLSTHPGPENRIARLERMIPEALAIYRG